MPLTPPSNRMAALVVQVHGTGYAPPSGGLGVDDFDDDFDAAVFGLASPKPGQGPGSLAAAAQASRAARAARG